MTSTMIARVATALVEPQLARQPAPTTAAPVPATGPDQRPTVLLSAFSAMPEYGSESLVGFAWIRLYLRSGWRVQLIIHEESREDLSSLRRDCAAEIADGSLVVHPIAMALAHPFLRRIPGLFFVAYRWYQLRVLALGRRVLADDPGIAFCHHVTLSSYREPGRLWRLPRPFVWGPVGGVQDADVRFLRWQRPRSRALERVRTALNRHTARVGMLPRRAARAAALVLAANREAEVWARRATPAPVARLFETAVTEGLPWGRADPAGRAGILMVANDDPRKNHQFALLAHALIARLMPGVTLTFAGHSPAKVATLTEFARANRLDLGAVRFVGKLPQRELAGLYQRHRVLWFPSYRDTSGNVVLEAMKSGLPTVAFDHQGEALMLADGAGALVPVVGGWRDLIGAWVRATLPVLRDDAVWRALARSGMERVGEELSWEGKRARFFALTARVPALAAAMKRA